MSLETYTIEKHVPRLIEMLEGGVIWNKCPSGMLGFGKDELEWANGEESVCVICRGFIGLGSSSMGNCPCDSLGYSEAVKRTWLALEDGGHLD